MEIVVWTWGKWCWFLVDVWPQLRGMSAVAVHGSGNEQVQWQDTVRKAGWSGVEGGWCKLPLCQLHCVWRCLEYFPWLSQAEFAAWVPICPNAFPSSSQVLYHMQQDLSASQQENCCEALRNLIVDQDSRQEPAEWRVFHEPWTSQAMEKFRIPDLDKISIWNTKFHPKHLKHSETIWFVILQGTSGILPFVVGTCGHIYPL